MVYRKLKENDFPPQDLRLLEGSGYLEKYLWPLLFMPDAAQDDEDAKDLRETNAFHVL